MDTPMALINERLGTLCDHITGLTKETAEIRECMGGLRADVKWLKKGFWLLASVVLTTLVADAIALF